MRRTAKSTGTRSPSHVEPTGSLFEPATLAAGIAYLSARDRRLAWLLERYPPEPRPRPTSLFANLCRTVCSQLLSNKAAASIFGRVETLCAGRIAPETLGVLDDGALRAAGLSRAKVASLRAIADYWEGQESIFRRLEGRGDAEVREALLSIRGLGPWSADMFLLFSLGRPDVFSARDSVLASGVARLKGLPPGAPAARAEAIARRWKPYRSVASLALYKWRHHDWAKE